MATYNVRCYFNTGFNAVNLPDGPTLLQTGSFTTKDYPAIDVLQDLDLSTIRLKATWNSIKNADYLEMFTEGGSVFYIITGIAMQATDVAELSVVCDYWTTAGGFENLTALDGITSRVHVIEDTYGAYAEDDVLTAPAHSPSLNYEWVPVYGIGEDQTYTLLETTIDLVKTGALTDSTSYSVPDKENEAAVVANVYPTYNTTEYYDTKTHTYTNPQTRVYWMTDTKTMDVPGASQSVWRADESIKKGIGACRSLGVEEAITRQVEIPVNCIDLSINYLLFTKVGGLETELFTDQIITDIQEKSATGGVSNISAAYADVKNKRVLYGAYTPVGIVTNAGNKIELNAEECLLSNGKFYVRSTVDPHLDGKAYYNLPRYGTTDDAYSIVATGVAGLPWKQVPLVYTSASGNLLNQYNLQNSRLLADTSQENFTRSNNFQEVQSAVSGFGDMISAAGQGNAGGVISGALNMGMSMASAEIARTNQQSSYEAAKAAEMSQYAVSQNVFVPTISFPYNSEIIRDRYGEGVLIYRYEYDPLDIARIDKLLTMYGYKYTKAVEDSDFTNRKYFNYIECSNITFKTKEHNVPKRVLDGAAMQVRVGVRLWHVKPAVSHYSNNPVL